MKLSKLQELLRRHGQSHARKQDAINLKCNIRRPPSTTETAGHTSETRKYNSTLNRLGVSALKLKVAQFIPAKGETKCTKGIRVPHRHGNYGDLTKWMDEKSNILKTSEHVVTADDMSYLRYEILGDYSRKSPVLVCPSPLHSEKSVDERLEYQLLKYEGMDPQVVDKVRELQKLLHETEKCDLGGNLKGPLNSSSHLNTAVSPAYLSFLLHRIKTLSGKREYDTDMIQTVMDVLKRGITSDVKGLGRIAPYKASHKTLLNDLSLNTDLQALMETIHTMNATAGVGGIQKPNSPSLVESKTYTDDHCKTVATDDVDYSQLFKPQDRDSKGDYDSVTVTKLSCEALASFANINAEMIREIALDLDCNPEMLSVEEASFILEELNVPYHIDFKESRHGVTMQRTKQTLVKRSLIVTIMGHVDHGKTTLLDTLQKSDIASGEAGAITQKLGAFKVMCDEGTLVFVDTPGHAAFSRMRDRGVRCADVVILVVAADDGVMPQTQEAIELIKREKMPFIVAVNKVDLDEGLHVPSMLEECGLNLDGVPVIYISAKYNRNIDKLKSELFSFAEKANLMVDAAVPGMAYIFETVLHPTWGGCLRAIIRNGTIKEGDWLVCGEQISKVKRMFDTNGTPIKVALPSDIVQISWSNDVGGCAGMPLHNCKSHIKAQRTAAFNKRLTNNAIRTSEETTVSPRLKNVPADGGNQAVDRVAGVPEIGVVLRCGDQGGLEAVMDWITEFNSIKRKTCDLSHLVERGYISAATTHEHLSQLEWEPIRVVAKNVGPFNRSDSQFVDAGISAFLGFSSCVPEGVPRPELVSTRNIIYELFNDIEKMYEFFFGERHLIKKEASMHVTQVGSITIKSAGKKQAIGTSVTSGTVRLNNPCMLIREGKTLLKNLQLLSMQSSRKQATELIKGDNNNCLVFKDCQEQVKVGDEIVSYTKEPLPPLFGVAYNCILSH